MQDIFIALTKIINTFSLFEWVILLAISYIGMIVTRWIIGFIKFLFSPIQHSSFDDGEYDKAFARCCVLFPIDRIRFNNKTFTRGMNVRITTCEGKSRMGKLVGSNKENFICLITTRFICAEMIDNVKDIIIADEKANGTD